MKLSRTDAFILVFDEIQAIENWTEAVKKEWDDDTRNEVNIKVVLIGSASLWGLLRSRESLMGRFEEIRLSHWSWSEMREAFDVGLAHYLYFGGYPGAAKFTKNEDQWRQEVRNILALSLHSDVLTEAAIRKPALLQRFLTLACLHSAQTRSLTRCQQQLPDAGNTTTLTAYMQRYEKAALLAGLSKYPGRWMHRRARVPQFQVFNSALSTALAPLTFEQYLLGAAMQVRYAKIAVGAHLLNTAFCDPFEIYYWQQGKYLVDFVLRRFNKTVAITMQTFGNKPNQSLEVFAQHFIADQTLVIGKEGLPLETFLERNPLDLFSR